MTYFYEFIFHMRAMSNICIILFFVFQFIELVNLASGRLYILALKKKKFPTIRESRP